MAIERLRLRGGLRSSRDQANTVPRPPIGMMLSVHDGRLNHPDVWYCAAWGGLRVSRVLDQLAAKA